MLKRFYHHDYLFFPMGEPRSLEVRLGHLREGCYIDAKLYLGLSYKACLLIVHMLLISGFFVMLLWFCCHRGFYFNYFFSIAVRVFVFQGNEKDLHDLLG